MVSSLTMMPALGPQQVDIPEAQAESMTQPNRVADALRCEAVTTMGAGPRLNVTKPA